MYIKQKENYITCKGRVAGGDVRKDTATYVGKQNH